MPVLTAVRSSIDLMMIGYHFRLALPHLHQLNSRDSGDDLLFFLYHRSFTFLPYLKLFSESCARADPLFAAAVGAREVRFGFQLIDLDDSLDL